MLRPTSMEKSPRIEPGADCSGFVAPSIALCASNGPGLRRYAPTLLDDVLALPNHGDNRSASHVLDQSREERLGRQVGVVLLEVLDRGVNELKRNELVTTLLEAGYVSSFAETVATYRPMISPTSAR